MDDFSNGSAAFNLILDSTDSRVVKQENKAAFSTLLNKPLNFSAGIWEVALMQLIFKPLGNGNEHHRIYFVPPDNPDEKTNLPFFEIHDLDLVSTPRDIINAINKSLPAGIKEHVEFQVDVSRQTYLTIQNTQIYIDSVYLASALGFEVKKLYPDSILTTSVTIKAPNRMDLINFGNKIFKVMIDITVPELYGSQSSQIIGFDVFTGSLMGNLMGLQSYMYPNPAYVRVLGSYFSSININIIDLFGNTLETCDKRYPILLKLHFRQRI